MEKYGVPVSTQSEEVKNKRARTNIEKYGNICSLHGEEIQKKVKEVKTKAYISKLFSSERILNIAQPLFTEKEYKGNIDSNGVPIYYQWKCIKCNNTFSDNIANGKVPRCSKCYPPKIQGIFEKELVDWLKEILPNEELLLNTRRIIPQTDSKEKLMKLLDIQQN
jgi:rubrerythrin